MDGRFSHALGQEDAENASENSGELGLGVSDVRSTTNSSSLKRSRRSVQKRVVTVPIGETDGSRIKTAENGAPPYDSWAWRKYGQKPIKGSPYPRGYYRCSSSKGCPARKQVERSRVDPTMLVITYACDHNHSGTPCKNPTSSSAAASTTAVTVTTTTNTVSGLSTSPVESESPIYATHSDDPDDKFTDLPVEADGFTWLSDVASTSEMILVNSTRSNSVYGESDATAAAVIFPMEDESLFADLGELPECSVVFQRGFVDQEAGGGGRRCVLRAG